jgi:gamma-glutamyltranspeptidase/glutathione hydrolase
MVAAGHPLTAQAGARVLREGGNAVDAAIGAVLASWVAEPLLTGPGAGATCSSPERARSRRCWTSSSRLPAGAPTRPPRAELLACEVSFGDAVQVFNCGASSCGTYGMTAGLAAALARWGSLDVAALAAPAAAMAREGVALNAAQAYVFEILEPILVSTAESRAEFAPDGRALREGELFRSPSWPRRSSASAPTARRRSTPATSPTPSSTGSAPAAASSRAPTSPPTSPPSARRCARPTAGARC